MKAHQVKCSLCANGVTVVVAQPKGTPDEDQDSIIEVFAGTLDEGAAVVLMSEVVAKMENESHNAMLEEDEGRDTITPEDIRLNWVFYVQQAHVRPVNEKIEEVKPPAP